MSILSSSFIAASQSLRSRLVGIAGNATRVWPWWLVAAVLLITISVISPQSVGVLILKFGQQLLAAIVGYHLSKVTLIHAVPEAQRQVPVISAALTLGRAIVMAGAMLAVGLGL